MKSLSITVLLFLGSISSYAQWQDPSGNGTGAIHYSGGNVGIGTNIAANLLDVRLNGSNGLTARFAEANGAGIILGVNVHNDDPLSGFIGHTSSNRNIKFHVGGTGNHIFSTEAGKSMTISNLGRVGIGVNTPANLLDVRLSGSNGLTARFAESNGSGIVLGVNVHNDDPLSGFIGHTSSNRNIKYHVGGTGNHIFNTNSGKSMTITNLGRVGIGTTTPDSKLTVAGKVHAQEVQVTVNAGADFVFEEDYELTSLEELGQYVKANKHLPEIASAKEMESEGIHLAEMNIKLLQKIEELTLHLIEMNKEIEILKTKVK